MPASVAIVGAGAAGSAVAYALREADVSVTVLEERSDVGGRAAGGHRDGCAYELGANYLTDDDERVSVLVTETLPTDGLVDIAEPVWTFDREGTIAEGDDIDDHKWTYRTGLDGLTERLLDAADAAVNREVRVEYLERADHRWRVVDAAGQDRGRYDAVVMTPPAPQTADLIGQSPWSHADSRPLRQAIETVPYRPVLSAVLHYPFDLDRPYYALVNADDAHDVGWIAREECKPGHVADGESVLLVQMAPDWSAERFGDDPEAVVADAADHAAALLDDDRLRNPDWTDHHAWRYALPNAAADPDELDRAADHDLYFAGDWVAGEARLHAAVRSGLETGERVASALGE